MDFLTIINYMEGAGLGTAAENLFMNFMPMSCKRGYMLRTPLSGIDINHEMPGYFKGEFTVIARAQDYATANTMMEEASAALKLSEVQIESIWVHYMRPKTLPVTFPVSDGNYFEVQVRFEFCFAAS